MKKLCLALVVSLLAFPASSHAQTAKEVGSAFTFARH